MKRLLFFVWLLFMSLTGCELIPGDPEIVLDPNVTFTVSKDTVVSGEKFIVTVSMENVFSIENNFGILITTNGPYEVVATSNMTDLKITVKNVAGKTTTFSKNIIVLPYISTALDSICSKPLMFEHKLYISIDNGSTWKSSDLDVLYDMYVFKKNGDLSLYKSPYSSTDTNGPGPWSIDLKSKTMRFGGNGDKRYVLTDKSLTVVFDNEYIDKDGSKHPALMKNIYYFK